MTKAPHTVDELKALRGDFRSRFDALKKAKRALLDLFRRRLEDRRKEEIMRELNVPRQ
jgi:hypothetical protein